MANAAGSRMMPSAYRALRALFELQPVPNLLRYQNRGGVDGSFMAEIHHDLVYVLPGFPGGCLGLNHSLPHELIGTSIAVNA
jgi:hypothetical protein